jgi:ATP-dependent RNA helicase RhlE
MLFSDLNLIAPLQQALREEGYSTPTPIQAQAIPIVLSGRDLLGCAQTGTGKTAAFSLPILQLLATTNPQGGKRPIRALILTPTRELAIQIGESLTAYGRHLSLRSLVIFGGVGQQTQTDALKKGVDVLVATPGRLLDLYNQGYVKLSSLEIFVLDEADRMLDMGFIHDVRKVVSFVPKERQTLFFSATMPNEIAHLAQSILHNPARVDVAPVSSTAERVAQTVYFTNKPDKRALLKHVLDDPSLDSVLVFTRTKHGADRVARELNKAGIKALAIHGDKSQTARQNALSTFKDRKTRVLVATDIAARGIDIEELGFVINFEVPNVPETYVHRIGRTGRAGLSGKAITFVDHEERPYLKDIQKLIGKTVDVVQQHPFPMSDTPPPPPEKRQPQPRGHRQSNPMPRSAQSAKSGSGNPRGPHRRGR